jgi:hypothetical protein
MKHTILTPSTFVFILGLGSAQVSAGGPHQMEKLRNADPKGSPMQMALRRACHPDALKYCADVLQSPPARQACMRQHMLQLSAACRQARSTYGID